MSDSLLPLMREEFADPDGTLARLESRLIPAENGCLLWSGSGTKEGYGQMGFKLTYQITPDHYGTRDLIHRIIYVLKVGMIPAGRTIDHLCNNKACANIEHLEVVTQSINSQRARSGERNGRNKVSSVSEG